MCATCCPRSHPWLLLPHPLLLGRSFVNTVPISATRTINRFALVRKLDWDKAGMFNAALWDSFARRWAKGVAIASHASGPAGLAGSCPLGHVRPQVGRGLWLWLRPRAWAPVAVVRALWWASRCSTMLEGNPPVWPPCLYPGCHPFLLSAPGVNGPHALTFPSLSSFPVCAPPAGAQGHAADPG